MAMVKCPECDGNVSNLAETCPHCGYPLKQKEQKAEEYILRKGSATGSGYATFIRVLAWICWIGGLIIAIAGAIVTVEYRYSSSTSFQFGTFLTLFLSYFIYGVILMCMATVVDNVANTYSIVSGLRLEKQDTNSTAAKSMYQDTKPNYLSKPAGGDWRCPVCKHLNKSWEDYCTNCGEKKH